MTHFAVFFSEQDERRRTLKETTRRSNLKSFASKILDERDDFEYRLAACEKLSEVTQQCFAEEQELLKVS
jgi:hypothetical protein